MIFLPLPLILGKSSKHPMKTGGFCRGFAPPERVVSSFFSSNNSISSKNVVSEFFSWTKAFDPSRWNLASALARTAGVVLSPSHPCPPDHPRCKNISQFLGFFGGKEKYISLASKYLWPMCWKVLKENWGPIHSLLAGPMWVTISTWWSDCFTKSFAIVGLEIIS